MNCSWTTMESPWTTMGYYGLFMDYHGLFMDYHGIPWTTMDYYHELPWTTMNYYHGLFMVFMAYHGLFMDYHGLPWTVHELPWATMSYHGLAGTITRNTIINSVVLLPLLQYKNEIYTDRVSTCRAGWCSYQLLILQQYIYVRVVLLCFRGGFFHSRVTGACPVTTDSILVTGWQLLY